MTVKSDARVRFLLPSGLSRRCRAMHKHKSHQPLSSLRSAVLTVALGCCAHSRSHAALAVAVSYVPFELPCARELILLRRGIGAPQMRASGPPGMLSITVVVVLGIACSLR